MAYNSYQTFAFNDAQEADPAPGAEGVPKAAPEADDPASQSVSSAPNLQHERSHDLTTSDDAAQDYAGPIDHSIAPHDLTLPSAFVDDPVAHQFAGFLHATGVPDDMADCMFLWYDSGLSHSQFAAEDAADIKSTRAELKAAWGEGEYANNLAAITRYLDRNLPPDIGELVRGTRLPNGQHLLNNTIALVELLGLAKNSLALPKSSGNLDADIKAIEDLMGTDSALYERDIGAKMRLRTLYAQRTARDRGGR